MTAHDDTPVPRARFADLCRLLTALAAALVEDGGLTPDAAAEFTQAVELLASDDTEGAEP